MYRGEKFVIAPIFMVFIFHGILYFLYPEMHYTSGYDGDSWVKYIKYLCLVLALPFIVARRFRASDLEWFLVGLLIFLCSFLPALHGFQEPNLLLLQFQVPILAYFFAPFLLRFFDSERRVIALLYLVLFISFLSAFYEMVNGGIATAFVRSGLRISGPFVNPNNTGIIVALVGTALHFRAVGQAQNLLILVLCLIVIVLTASKTAYFVYALGLALSVRIGVKATFAGVFIIIFGFFSQEIVALFEAVDLREFSLSSGEIRLSHFALLLQSAGNGDFLDVMFGWANVSRVDNAYLDLFAFGGLISLLIFVAVQIFSAVIIIKKKQYILLCALIQLIAAMMTTNIPRLWPTAYIYWALVGVAVFYASHRRSHHVNTLRNIKNRNRGKLEKIFIDET